MPRMLKMALEGEPVEVVEGMFIGVPIGMGEDVEAISTESFGDAVKNAGKKIWEWIVKIAAAIAAAIKGFLNTILGKTRKHRKMSDEVQRNYELLVKRFTSRRPLTVEDKIQSVIKADKLDEEFLGRITKEGRAFLASDQYKAGMETLAEMISKNGHRTDMVDAANAFIKAINNPGKADTKHLTTIREIFEKYLGPMQEAFVKAKEGFEASEAGEVTAPETSREQAALVQTTYAHVKSLQLITKTGNWEQTLKDIERTIANMEKMAKQRASIAETGGYDDAATKSLQDALKLYWDIVKGYMQAVKMVDKYETALWRLTDEIIRFRKEALIRTMAVVSGDQRKEIEEELDELYAGELRSMFRSSFGDMFN